jgi:hypothetical protein
MDGPPIHLISFHFIYFISFHFISFHFLRKKERSKKLKKEGKKCSIALRVGLGTSCDTFSFLKIFLSAYIHLFRPSYQINFCIGTKEYPISAPREKELYFSLPPRYVWPCGIHTSAYYHRRTTSGNNDCPTCGAAVSEMTIYGSKADVANDGGADDDDGGAGADDDPDDPTE